jgi:hypothetical protein
MARSPLAAVSSLALRLPWFVLPSECTAVNEHDLGLFRLRGIQMQKAHRNKIVLIAVLGFCLLELLDWTGITRGGFPSDWRVALIQVCVNIGWTAFCTTVAYFTMIRPTQGSSSVQNGPARGSKGPGDSSTQG